MLHPPSPLVGARNWSSPQAGLAVWEVDWSGEKMDFCCPLVRDLGEGPASCVP